MSLNDWQNRLQAHFAQLRQERLQLGVNGTLFALEHGLSNSEIASLCADIRVQIKSTSPSERHWLPWTVYATEIGYKFSGDEYWTTFAESTPGWEQHGDRSWVRDAFARFHREYKSARPSGRWAEHRSIICWPITHAILPQDLQRQLAEVLYDIRSVFTADLLRSPERLGEQIEAHSWSANSRFQNLAEQHLLVGQVATALLLSEEEQRGTALILPTTLKRIAGDLDRERRARDWLSDAKSRAAKVRLRGLQRPYLDEDADALEGRIEQESESRKLILALGVEPRILLRRKATDVWEVRLQLPDLSRLLSRFPHFRSILANERCAVVGTSGTAPLARGRLLYGHQEVVLTRWPASSDVLLKFDNSTPELDYLLTAECLLRPGPRWLFKILDDGSAVKIRTKTVQPGSSYIVLTRNDSSLSRSWVQGPIVQVTCEGVTATRLDMPDVVSRVYSEELSGLGIQPATGLRVFPAGLPSAGWADDGQAQWLTTDHPTIAITATFEMKAILLNLVGASHSVLEINSPSTGSPTIVDLGQLDVGNHTLHVIVKSGSDQEPLVTGNLRITIRDPKPWKCDISDSTAFSVYASPANPQLEQLWGGSVAIQLLGPNSRKADCHVRFFKDLSATELLASRRLSAITLPCEPLTFENLFSSLKGDVRVQNAYDECELCILHFECEELGHYTLRCEREFVPLRWVLKQENNGYFLRVAQLDQAGHISLSHYPFEHPELIQQLSPFSASGFRVPAEGGLFVATFNHYRQSIVAPPLLQSFADLAPTVHPHAWNLSEGDISQLLNVLELWSSARVTGDPISRLRREYIVITLRNQLISMLCGSQWRRLEAELAKQPSRIFDFQHLVATGVRYVQLWRDLIKRHNDFKNLSVREVCELLYYLTRSHLDLPIFSLAQEHGVSKQEWIVQFAFNLMNSPETVRDWSQADFMAGLHYVLRHLIILRMARFAVLSRNVRDSALGDAIGSVQ